MFHFKVGFSLTFSTSSQGRGSEASLLTGHDTAQALSELQDQLSAHVVCIRLVPSLQRGGQREISQISLQSSICQPAGAGRHREHRNLPWSHGNKLPGWFPSSQCCTTAVQFSFFFKLSLELKNQLNSWFNCPAQLAPISLWVWHL